MLYLFYVPSVGLDAPVQQSTADVLLQGHVQGPDLLPVHGRQGISSIEQ